MLHDEAVRAQVAKVLAASEFRSSERLSRLLRYLADTFISSPEKEVSEYQLAFDVFDRDQEFDPHIDSVVRVQTSRLRQKLAKYYAAEGSSDEILLEIPRGGYFLRATIRDIPKPRPETIAHSRPRLRVRVAWLAALLIVLTMAVVSLVRRPVLSGSRPSEPLVIPFTSDPGIQDDAAFSPDGASVAFSGSSGNGREIFIKQMQTGQLRQLTHDNGISVNPAWSPDGSAIAFYRVRENGGDFVIVPLDGGAVHIVGHSRSMTAGSASEFSPMADIGPAWADDTDHLIIADKNGVGGADCLFLLNVKDGSRTLLTSPPLSIVGDGSPALSPDGKTIAFVRVTSYNSSDIFLVSPRGGQPLRVTFDNADIRGVAWTANSSQVIFSSNRGGAHRLWRLSLDTKQIQPFPASSLNALHPAVDANRDRLIYTEWTFNTNIWRVDLRSPPEQRRAAEWIRSTLHQDSPKYSPDGKHIVFVSDRSGYWELWLADSSGQNLRQLTRFTGPSAGSPQWSNNGQDIAFDLRADGVSNIFTVNAKTGAVRQITHESADCMAPHWSADGSFFYVVSRRTGQLQIWKTSLDGTLWTQLTRNGGFDAAELPGNQQLLFSLPRAAGFWTLDFRSGDESVIPALTAVKSYRYWTASPRGVYYVSGGSQHAPINFYDFRTQGITRVAEINGSLFSGTPSLTVSPDGRYLAYAEVDSYNGSLVLVDNW
jgi:Tol biopolymer transport system component